MSGNYDVIVIGSGLGGLTAGALAARAGYQVLVLERNQSVGGAASVYQQDELSIEASLHETTDPHNPQDPCHRIFATLGILDDIQYVPVDNFYEVRGKLFKKPFVLPHGMQAARSALQSHFPKHARVLDTLFERFKKSDQFMGLLSTSHSGLWWLFNLPRLVVKFWPVLRDIKKSLAEVFQQLFADDEAIKIALAANLGYYADDPDRLWWFFFAMAQGGYLRGGGYYIHGGSQVLSNCLVKVIEASGGSVKTSRPVTRILLDEQGKACGVEHEHREGGDIQTAYAPVLFGNAAPHVLASALPADVRGDFMHIYDNRPLSLSLFSISLGIAHPPATFGVSSYSTIIVPDWMASLGDTRFNADLLHGLPGERCPMLTIVDYSRIDSGLNVKPPYLLSIVGFDRLANWQSLSDEDYHHKRDQWLEAIIHWVDEEYPGLAEAITQKSMSTALSMHRYLNTPEGAIYGFAPVPPERISLKESPYTPKTTIDGLWLASSYANGGGFTGAIISGASAASMALNLKQE